MESVSSEMNEGRDLLFMALVFGLPLAMVIVMGIGVYYLRQIARELKKR